MFFVVSIHKKTLLRISITLILLGILALGLYKMQEAKVIVSISDELLEEIQQIFYIRNEAILAKDVARLESFYDRQTKYGSWAFEHEMKKIKYLHNWSDKQGVQFTDIDSDIFIKYVKDRGTRLTINLTRSTEYKYSYENEPHQSNLFRIGTYHQLDIIYREGGWKIIKEWYTDPFADSLNMDSVKSDNIKDLIISSESRDFSGLSSRRIDAVKYADQYCGAAAEKNFGYSYNEKYRNYNPLGGDCANFASQILYEGGKFKKTQTWKYDGGGSKAWVNAQAFKNFMTGSGRASVIASGTYDKVVKASYKLLPGDFIAYEKKGKIIHISIVTGADSKGYSLINCHNTDRYRVPWDLGWSDKGIKFWLVRVHF